MCIYTQSNHHQAASCVCMYVCVYTAEAPKVILLLIPPFTSVQVCLSFLLISKLTSFASQWPVLKFLSGTQSRSQMNLSRDSKRDPGCIGYDIEWHFFVLFFCCLIFFSFFFIRRSLGYLNSLGWTVSTTVSIYWVIFCMLCICMPYLQ